MSHDSQQDIQKNKEGEYRGYTFSVQPVKGHDDLWHDAYKIFKVGKLVAEYANTNISHSDVDTAIHSSINYAKLEIDNLVN